MRSNLSNFNNEILLNSPENLEAKIEVETDQLETFNSVNDWWDNLKSNLKDK